MMGWRHDLSSKPDAFVVNCDGTFQKLLYDGGWLDSEDE